MLDDVIRSDSNNMGVILFLLHAIIAHELLLHLAVELNFTTSFLADELWILSSLLLGCSLLEKVLEIVHLELLVSNFIVLLHGLGYKSL